MAANSASCISKSSAHWYSQLIGANALQESIDSVEMCVLLRAGELTCAAAPRRAPPCLLVAVLLTAREVSGCGGRFHAVFPRA